jgi:hypothetical protein
MPGEGTASGQHASPLKFPHVKLIAAARRPLAALIAPPATHSAHSVLRYFAEIIRQVCCMSLANTA